MRLTPRLNALLLAVVAVILATVVYRQVGPARNAYVVDPSADLGSGTASEMSSDELKAAIVAATPGPGLQRVDPTSFVVALVDAGKLAPGLTAQLPATWSRATRGLGKLSLCCSREKKERPDIVVYFKDYEDPDALGVEHEVRRGRTLTQRWIEVFTLDRGRRLTAPELMAVTLHELGHLWCCVGPDAAPDGHWAGNVEDAGLTGINRYGLMGTVPLCSGRPPTVVCADRFSERELRAMGFTEIPPPK